jgi:hypothetical protein
MNEEQVKLMIWAYRKGYESAVKSLSEGLKEVNEDEMLKTFKQIVKEIDQNEEDSSLN